jgi:arsenite oxidase large subunit
VEVNPEDAKARGIESGDMVMIYSNHVPSLKETTLGVEGSDYSFSGQMKNGNVELSEAAVTAVAMVTRAVKKNVLYMDFLHTSQPANALEGRVVDWISGNYNYKMGVARIQKIGESQYKKEHRSFSWAPRNIV